MFLFFLAFCFMFFFICFVFVLCLVLNVASISGLSILDCSFGFLSCLFTKHMPFHYPCWIWYPRLLLYFILFILQYVLLANMILLNDTFYIKSVHFALQIKLENVISKIRKNYIVTAQWKLYTVCKTQNPYIYKYILYTAKRCPSCMVNYSLILRSGGIVCKVMIVL